MYTTVKLSSLGSIHSFAQYCTKHKIWNAVKRVNGKSVGVVAGIDGSTTTTILKRLKIS